MDLGISKPVKIFAVMTIGMMCLFLMWQLLVPVSLRTVQPSVFTIEKGSGSDDIAIQLKARGIISNARFFKLYVLVSGNYKRLQAGSYELAPSMSIFSIVKKFSYGEIVKELITIPEGWNAQQIGYYLESKNIGTAKDFSALIAKDFALNFSVLKDKPKKLNLEGYLFPDTYEISRGQTQEDLVKTMLKNFTGKITPAMQQEIARQGKTLFQIITMASILEKEVQTLEDKKVVAGVLWARLKAGVALQVDATVNYVTGRSDRILAIKDTKIHSLYNTYENPGLPLGPISNPGIESIMASMYPTKSDYWYYLSTNTGKTIFSTTLDEHNAAIVKYLR